MNVEVLDVEQPFGAARRCGVCRLLHALMLGALDDCAHDERLVLSDGNHPQARGCLRVCQARGRCSGQGLFQYPRHMDGRAASAVVNLMPTARAVSNQ